MVKGIGAVRTRKLLDFFGSLEVAWQAPVDALRAAGLPLKIAEQVRKLRREADLDSIITQIHSQGIEVLTWGDDDYPRRLKEIETPPPVLYLRGTITEEDDWAVAIVGTRKMTSYGRQVADELAAYLAHNGVTIVSGLARGVDSAAHKGALKVGGRTLAVLGSGVDRIYPPEHRKLAGEIVKQGALLSDYAPGTPPEGVNFPPRNRLISGLSLATVVVEAGERSGALITATFAAEQGREVFAVPGSIQGPQSKGANRLIREGARPLLHVEDVLKALNLEKISVHRQARAVLPANELEERLFQLIADEPMHVDEIGDQSGLPIEMISATLAVMELKGLVRQVGGMSYLAVREQQADYGEVENG